MNGNKVKKKPTIREITNAVIELNNRVNSIMGLLSELEKAFSLYVQMNNHNDKFTKYINEKVKEYKKQQDDAKANGVAHPEDIPANPDDKRSRAEGIR